MDMYSVEFFYNKNQEEVGRITIPEKQRGTIVYVSYSVVPTERTNIACGYCPFKLIAGKEEFSGENGIIDLDTCQVQAFWVEDEDEYEEENSFRVFELNVFLKIREPCNTPKTRHGE